MLANGCSRNTVIGGQRDFASEADRREIAVREPSPKRTAVPIVPPHAGPSAEPQRARGAAAFAQHAAFARLLGALLERIDPAGQPGRGILAFEAGSQPKPASRGLVQGRRGQFRHVGNGIFRG